MAQKWSGGVIFDFEDYVEKQGAVESRQRAERTLYRCGALKAPRRLARSVPEARRLGRDAVEAVAERQRGPHGARRCS